MVKTVDFAERKTISAVESHRDYDKWDADMSKRTLRVVKVPGFDATVTDLNKILEEVEMSCLSEKCKKSLTEALKKAK